MKTTLIEELYALQETHGYLRDPDLRELSERIRVPLYEIEGVSSFYPHFRRTPPPRLHVTACRDLSCAMNGAHDTLRQLRALCESKDGVEFHEVSCLGRCDMAPACAVNEVPVPADAVEGHLDDSASIPSDEPTASPRQWKCDPYRSPEDRYGVLREALAGGDGEAPSGSKLDEVVARLKATGIRGMGGAGFPTGVKWELVRKMNASPKYVVCNADESEPGSFKDRVILEELPHLVIEGLTLGALTVGAHEGWIYIRHEYGRARLALQRALDEAYDRGVLGQSVCGAKFAFELKIFVSPGGYILGEETALLEALEGKRGEPRNKPPYPGTHGLFGKPTLINNVETLAHIPSVLRSGRQQWKFFSVSGDVPQPSVLEVETGTRLSELVEACGGIKDGKVLQAFLPGGASTGFLTSEHREIVMDWKPLQEAGSALGSGAVVVVSEGRDLLELARNLTAFFRNESCGKCVPCRIGTEKAVLLIDGRTPDDLALLPELHETLLQTSICGLGQAALNPVLSVLSRKDR